MEPDNVRAEPTVIEFGLRAREVEVGGRANVAERVTALLGIEKVQGLLEELPEQDAPDIVQLEKCQPELGVAVTVTEEPGISRHSVGQLGLTLPRPESTSVVKPCVVNDDVSVVVIVDVPVDVNNVVVSEVAETNPVKNSVIGVAEASPVDMAGKFQTVSIVFGNE